MPEGSLVENILTLQGSLSAVTDLTDYGQGLLEMFNGPGILFVLLNAPQIVVSVAKVAQAIALGAAITGLESDSQRPLVMLNSLLDAPLDAEGVAKIT